MRAAARRSPTGEVAWTSVHSRRYELYLPARWAVRAYVEFEHS